MIWSPISARDNINVRLARPDHAHGRSAHSHCQVVEYNPVACVAQFGTNDKGGQHESLCANSFDSFDPGADGSAAVVADGTAASDHRRRIRKLEERPFKLGTLGQGRSD